MLNDIAVYHLGEMGRNLADHNPHGAYIERLDGLLRFRWLEAPSGAELTRLTQTLARRIVRHLERQELLERGAENSCLAGDVLESGQMEQILGSSITYRMAVGPLKGRKMFTLPACDEPFDDRVESTTP